jgi:hypothetical protein
MVVMETTFWCLQEQLADARRSCQQLKDEMEELRQAHAVSLATLEVRRSGRLMQPS